MNMSLSKQKYGGEQVFAERTNPRFPPAKAVSLQIALDLRHLGCAFSSSQYRMKERD
jgi:hypothetical protein